MRGARSIVVGVLCCAGLFVPTDDADAAGWLPPNDLASGDILLPVVVATPTFGSQNDDVAIAAWRIADGMGNYKIQTAVWRAGGTLTQPRDLYDFESEIPENLDLATDAAGNAILTFRKPVEGFGVALFYSYRPAGGEFSPPQEVTGAGKSVAVPDTAMDKAGNAITVFLRAPGGDFHLAYVVRPAGGDFGEQQELTEYPADEPRVEFAPDGSAIAAWTNNNREIEAARRAPGGSFGPIQTLSAKEAEYPTLEIGPGGRSLLAWERFNGLHLVVEAALAEPGAPFGAPAPLSGGGGHAMFPTAAVGPGNVSFLAWGEAPKFDLRAAAAPPQGPFAAAVPPLASDSFPVGAEYGPDGSLMLLWKRGDEAPRTIMAAVRTPAGEFGPSEALSPVGENHTAERLAGDGAGNFLALYRRDEGGPRSTLKLRAYDGEPPKLLSLSLPDRPRTGRPASFSASFLDRWSGTSVEWEFGDGGSAAGESAQHTFRRTGGPRTVTVTATDAAGNAHTERRTIVVRDATPPRIVGARFTPRAFAARGGRGKSASASAVKPRGSSLRFRLSEPARVRIAFERLLRGRRKGRRCVGPSRAPRGKPCVRHVRLRAKPLGRRGRQGGNRLSFNGRVGGRALAPGRYRAVLTAIDTGGLRSRRPATAGFRIVAP